MRKIIFLVLSAFLLPFFALISRAQTFSFTESDLKVKAGEEVTFGINLNSENKLIRGFQVTITLPENIVVTDIQNGSTFTDFEVLPKFDGYKGGQFIIMALDLESDYGNSVNGELLTLTLQSLGDEPVPVLEITFDNPLVAYPDGTKNICDGPKSLDLEVVVPVSQISLQSAGSNINVGDLSNFAAVVYPPNASNGTVSWQLIQDEVFAEISSQGNNNVTIKGLAPGKVRLLCTATDGYGVETSTEIEILEVKPQSVVIEPIEELLYAGSIVSLNAVVSPANTTYPTVTWASGNSQIVSVDKESGVLTALNYGETFVTATCGEISSSMPITVLPTALAAISISYEDGNFPLYLKEGEEIQLLTNVTPSEASHPISYTWSSSNSQIATVNNNGLVTARAKTGTASISVTATNQAGIEVSQSVEIIVQPTPLSEIIILNPQPATLLDGQKLYLKFTWQPYTATQPIQAYYQSSDNDIVTVDNLGEVTAHAKIGTATITVTADNEAQQPVTTEFEITVAETISDYIEISLPDLKSYYVGETGTAEATVYPETTTDKTVVWSTDTPDILAIDSESGLFIATGIGNGVIRATNGEATATAVIRIVPTPLQTVTINTLGSTTLRDGMTLQLTATTTPENATDPIYLYWSSNDTDIATVDSEGLITAGAKVGTAIITVSATNSANIEVTDAINITVEPTPPSEISLKLKEDKSYQVGDSGLVLAIVSPVTTTDKTIVWSTETPNILSVDENSGEFEALGIGTGTITATCGDVAESINIEVVETPIESVTVSATGSTTLRDGDTLQLSASILPSDATQPISLMWVSSDSEIASVDKNGLVTAGAKTGLATITVTADNEAESPVSGSIIIIVEKTPAESVVLSEATLKLEKGAIFKLSATVEPINTTDPTIIWISANNEVASVDATGTVTAILPGTTTITASCGNVSASCEVTVVEKSTSVGTITSDSDTTDIYTMTGILIKRNATPEDIKALPPALYIIGGKKILIR